MDRINDRGWGRLIHDASHYVYQCRHPSARPHDGGHATLEREMALYAATSKRLLARPVAPPKARPVKDAAQERIERLARIDAAIKRWSTKAKRAETALQKLGRKRRRLAKQVGLAVA